ncbi:MAG: YraN family protein [Gammaproteobacteria bacterium]|nr:MAG: YraN family protein [Gammaproteobacteria bacterium]
MTKQNASSRNKGQEIEALVEQHLRNQGLKFVARNFNCKLGEIDLIFTHENILIFTEVKYRKKPDFGSSIETVTPTKQKKIIKTAQLYLQKNKWARHYNCRFDVVGVNPVKSEQQTSKSNTPDRGTLNINWIKDAFWAS